jgi:hypothetical protein
MVALINGFNLAYLLLFVVFFMPGALVFYWKSRRSRSSAEILMRVIEKE